MLSSALAPFPRPVTLQASGSVRLLVLTFVAQVLAPAAAYRAPNNAAEIRRKPVTLQANGLAPALAHPYAAPERVAVRVRRVPNSATALPRKSVTAQVSG